MNDISLGNKYAEASYKYLHMYGELVIYSLQHDKRRKFPRWSVYGLIHDMEQILTEIESVYNGKNIIKWGADTTEELIDMMTSNARGCVETLEKLNAKKKK